MHTEAFCISVCPRGKTNSTEVVVKVLYSRTTKNSSFTTCVCVCVCACIFCLCARYTHQGERRSRQRDNHTKPKKTLDALSLSLSLPSLRRPTTAGLAAKPPPM